MLQTDVRQPLTRLHESVGLFYPFFYCQVFARLHGVPENIAFYSLAIINAASVFGRVLPNFIADKVSPRMHIRTILRC